MDAPPSQRPTTGALQIAAAAVLWSSGGLFIKLAPMSGLAVACGRALVTGAFYLAVLRPRLGQARWSTGLVYAGMVVTFVWATKATTAANAVFLQYTGTVWVLALGPFVLRERFQKIDAACVVLSLLGVALLFAGRTEGGRTAGNLVGALSGLFFAFTIMLLRRDARSDAMPSIVLGNLLAGVIALPLVAPELLALSVRGAGILAYLGVIQMGIPYILFARGLRVVPAAQASLIAMIEPATNPLWVFLGTGEQPGPWAIAGGAIVLGAVAVRTLARRRSTAAVG